ncbi:hypothetical protein IV203_024095 [Nitzschia inconspicua]|uniref:Uncharacterized protein n=1 Tax=Nitzschia inconspicua TaxID=303405 RepID=A0A9K3KBK5_9STRA|nr:hypothetical protein IV203_024095 [Nitzschia inconspicua]
MVSPPLWNQITTCLSPSCNDEERNVVRRSLKVKKEVGDWCNEKNLIDKKEDFGKVVPSIASSTTTLSCSESNSSVFQKEKETMVFKTTDRVVGRSKVALKKNDVQANIHRKTNQLVQAISPYDELPVMQDLFDQLSPNPTVSKHLEQREVPQHRTQSMTKEKQDQREQQRDPPMKTSPYFEHDFYMSSYTGAHDVPTMIEIPRIPTKSEEESELTLNGTWKGSDCTADDRGPRSLTPHPSFEEVEPTDVDFQYLFQAGMTADEELWPSDEERLCKTMLPKNKDTSFWTKGSMNIWDLEGDDDDEFGIEVALSNRRKIVGKKKSGRSKSMAMF